MHQMSYGQGRGGIIYGRPYQAFIQFNGSKRDADHRGNIGVACPKVIQSHFNPMFSHLQGKIRYHLRVLCQRTLCKLNFNRGHRRTVSLYNLQHFPGQIRLGKLDGGKVHMDGLHGQSFFNQPVNIFTDFIQYYIREFNNKACLLRNGYEFIWIDRTYGGMIHAHQGLRIQELPCSHGVNGLVIHLHAVIGKLSFQNPDDFLPPLQLFQHLLVTITNLSIPASLGLGYRVFDITDRFLQSLHILRAPYNSHHYRKLELVILVLPRLSHPGLYVKDALPDAFPPVIDKQKRKLVPAVPVDIFLGTHTAQKGAYLL